MQMTMRWSARLYCPFRPINVYIDSHSPICVMRWTVLAHASALRHAFQMHRRLSSACHRHCRRHPYTHTHTHSIIIISCIIITIMCALHIANRMRESFTFCRLRKTERKYQEINYNKLGNLFRWKLLLLLRRIHWTYSRLSKLHANTHHFYYVRLRRWRRRNTQYLHQSLSRVCEASKRARAKYVK